MTKNEAAKIVGQFGYAWCEERDAITLIRVDQSGLRGSRIRFDKKVYDRLTTVLWVTCRDNRHIAPRDCRGKDGGR